MIIFLGKKLHQGKEYDYVFDIEIDEPKSTLKLPFNVTDDPYMAAQQYIHNNVLSQYYLEEIANHIIKMTGGQNLGKFVVLFICCGLESKLYWVLI